MNKTRLIILFDYYGDLLTEKQKNVFSDYHLDDMSFKEISENDNISRTAIFKQVKKVEQKLEEYEKILHLYEKSLMIKEIIKNEVLISKIEEFI